MYFVYEDTSFDEVTFLSMYAACIVFDSMLSLYAFYLFSFQFLFYLKFNFRFFSFYIYSIPHQFIPDFTLSYLVIPDFALSFLVFTRFDIVKNGISFYS